MTGRKIKMDIGAMTRRRVAAPGVLRGICLCAARSLPFPLSGTGCLMVCCLGFWAVFAVVVGLFLGGGL